MKWGFFANHHVLTKKATRATSAEMSEAAESTINAERVTLLLSLARERSRLRFAILAEHFVNKAVHFSGLISGCRCRTSHRVLAAA